jgi:molybdenum cofactor cytidylyltransferase
MNYHLAGLLLAGGQSARYAGNKLLSQHPIANTSLVTYSAYQLKNALSDDTSRVLHHDEIVVVTGKWDKSVRDALSHLPVSVITNTNWQEGIAASIREGINYLAAGKPLVDIEDKHSVAFTHSEVVPSHILITLADLPKISSYDLRALIEASNANPSHVVCSEWLNEGKTKLTVPAIFPADAFNDLMAISGDIGAKPVIMEYKKLGKLTAVPIPNAEFDIDTPQDWTSLY